VPSGWSYGLRGESLGLTIFVITSFLLGAVLVISVMRQQRRTAVQI